MLYYFVQRLLRQLLPRNRFGAGFSPFGMFRVFSMFKVLKFGNQPRTSRRRR